MNITILNGLGTVEDDLTLIVSNSGPSKEVTTQQLFSSAIYKQIVSSRLSNLLALCRHSI